MDDIIKKVLLKISNKKSFKDREYWGKYEGYISVVLNVAFFIIKLLVGIISGSIAIMADAFHTLFDIVSSIGVIFGFKIAYSPADKKHPYGYGRFEHILTLGVSFLLLYTGMEFIKEGINHIKNPEIIEFNIYLFLSILLTIFLKEVMAKISIIIGKTINSNALIADGKHHRIDVLSTVVVIFTFFVRGVDGYLSIIVSLFIIYSAYEIAKSAVDSLLGEKPSKKFINELKEYVLKFKVAEGVHDIIVNKYGERYIVSLHVEMDINYSFDEAHYWSEEIEDALDNEFGIKSIVHIDPVDKNDEEIKKIKSILNRIIVDIDFIDSFHDIRKIGGKKVNVVMDLVVKENIGNNKKSKLKKEIYMALSDNIKNFNNLVIKFEPLYAY